MRFLFAVTFLLMMMMIDHRFSAEADPASVLHGSTERSSWCNEHKTLHSRLDAVEEKVEKTVEYLYSEVETLLDTITHSAQIPSLVTEIPMLDIFEEDSS
ncbi:placenta-specific protein 9-like [Rhinatrema bivittatum]|uniref:placenta-specific protein 9-like n=1 Tax=Rhinatrema bivittatum TaxID=194408 RepID=UPI00112BBDCC|nr:placenta-specific protein 9-like [Rhinatrema bivittatum]